MKCTIRVVAALLGVALLGGVARAQYPQPYVAPRSPYAYPGPAGPIRQGGPQAFSGSSYGFQSPGSASCYTPPSSNYPVYSSFYDPRLTNPRYIEPGPYWYTQTYPFTNGYYSYYYTPGYFRY